VKEPLLDWSKEVKTQMSSSSLDNSSESEDDSISTVKNSKKQKEDWYPRRKVETVRMKLSRSNPVALMIRDEMVGKLSRHAKPIRKQIERIIWGPKDCLRRKYPKYMPSVELQAECLVEMATDPNILGRQWQGLKTWC